MSEIAAAACRTWRNRLYHSSSVIPSPVHALPHPRQVCCVTAACRTIARMSGCVPSICDTVAGQADLQLHIHSMQRCVTMHSCSLQALPSHLCCCPSCPSASCRRAASSACCPRSSSSSALSSAASLVGPVRCCSSRVCRSRVCGSRLCCCCCCCCGATTAGGV